MLELREIIKDSDPLLREKTQKVTFPLSKEDEEAANYLLNHLIFAADDENVEKYNLRAGVGLAAPQIGVLKQMLALYIPKYDEENNLIAELKYILINPKIISHSQRKAYLLAGEGCLSVDESHEGYVYRYAFLTIKAFNLLTNQEETIKLRGYEAIVLQHELDHLNGILFYDHINKENPFLKIEGALEI